MSKRDWGRPRYSVRYHTKTEQVDDLYVCVVLSGWWLYDWKENKTVQMFPVSEEAQANAVCKLMNSIEEENDGVSK